MSFRTPGALALTGPFLFALIWVASLSQPESRALPPMQSSALPEAGIIQNNQPPPASAQPVEPKDLNPVGTPQDPTGTPVTQETGKKAGASYQLQKVKEWRIAAEQHSSGKPDAAAVSVGRWQTQDLESVVDYITKLASQPTRSIKKAVAKARIQRLLNLTEIEAQQGDLSRVLKHGVLLHTDIALLDLETSDNQLLQEGMVVFADGQTLMQPKKHHWEFARKLLDSLPPGPAHNPVIRKWYIGTTAYMQSNRLLGYAGTTLKGAMEKFPNDDRILFYAGALHESWASPVNQSILLPKGGKLSYGSRDWELGQARQFFLKSIALNPGCAEAHLRLGRVLGLLGRHDQAQAELQQAFASLGDPQLSYYASLYLGHELATLSRRSEARNYYERAAALYPKAQSPLLALSQLAHSSGDNEEALNAIQRMLTLPARDYWKDDPWWDYDLSHVRDARALLAEMRAALGGAPR